MQKEVDEKNAALAEKVESAKLEQIQLQFEQDMETLKKRVPTPEVEAMETAKDQMFLRERQRTSNKNISQIVCLFLGWQLFSHNLLTY